MNTAPNTPAASRPTTNRRRTMTSIGSYPVETTEPRKIILEVEGDTLSLRHFRSSKRYRITIDRAMQEAMLEHAAAELENSFMRAN